MARNVDCPYYQTCLDRAVKLDSAGWECDGCRHEFTFAETGQTDFTEYYVALMAIFRPEVYEKINELRRLQRESFDVEQQPGGRVQVIKTVREGEQG